MARYRVHFVDLNEQVIDAVELKADSDEAAIEEAYRICARLTALAPD